MIRTVPPCALALGLLAAASLPAAAPLVPDPDARAAREIDHKLMNLAKDETEVVKNLAHLSDHIGHRLTGSDGLQRAAEWAAGRMKSYGLTDVHLEPYTIPIGWKRGKAEGRVVEPNNGQKLILAAGGWSPGTKGKITGDVVILKAQSAKDLEAYKGKLENAIVLTGPPAKLLPLDKLIDPNKMIFSAAEFRFDKTAGPELKALQMLQGEFLRKEKAGAVLRDSRKPFGLLVTTGSWGSDRAAVTGRVPTLYVANNSYALLHRLASRGEGRTRVELDVENSFTDGPVKVSNVVGEIKGSEKPDEYVVLGAHLDSWDLAQGTLDNGTGTSVVLEAARVIARSGVKPKRTIRFVLFSGEEQGLHGSRFHCENNKAIMAKTSACFVHDTGTGRIRGVGAGGNRAAQREVLQRELATLKDVGVTDFTTPTGGGSDHQSFAKAGVPAFMMVQESGGYVFAHHTQADTLDAAKEADLIQGAQTLAVTAMRVANLPGMMPRAGGKR